MKLGQIHVRITKLEMRVAFFAGGAALLGSVIGWLVRWVAP
jgi:hypothetical protein